MPPTFVIVGASRDVELRTVAPAGHDGPLQRSFCGERALLVRAGVVDREEVAIGIGYGDTDSFHVECGKLAGPDIRRRANRHGPHRPHSVAPSDCPGA